MSELTSNEKGEATPLEQPEKDKPSQQTPTGEHHEPTGGHRNPPQPEQRQQGDEDLDEDSKSQVDSQGMK